MNHLIFNQTEIIEAIDTNLLLLWGGVFKNYKKGEYIFREGQQPHFYHQIVSGRIKMASRSEDGKDFIQGFFSSGQSFGEPPIFGDDVYPASAIAVMPTTIIRLGEPSFKKLLRENSDVHWNLTKLLAKRIIKKAKTLKDVACLSPANKVLSVLDHYKQEKLLPGHQGAKVRIEYTRKQIAEMTGLRIETVIRIMRSLFEEKTLSIEKGKVYY